MQLLASTLLKTEQLPFPAQTLAKAATQLSKELGNVACSFFARPVPLQFAQIDRGSDGFSA